jgi:hypothetical protein
MNPFNDNIANKLGITKLYPDLTPEQQEEAEYFLTRYVDLMRQIFERLECAKDEQDERNLTEDSHTSTMPMN